MDKRLIYPVFPRRSTTAYHDSAQSTEYLTGAEIMVDTWMDMETQIPLVYSSKSQSNHDQHTDGNLQI